MKKALISILLFTTFISIISLAGEYDAFPVTSPSTINIAEAHQSCCPLAVCCLPPFAQSPQLKQSLLPPSPRTTAQQSIRISSTELQTPSCCTIL